MAEVTERTAPAYVPSSNALDDIPADLLDTPPAYYKFGVSPCAMENPMKQGDVEVLMVRVRCKEEHGPLERGDGELRYERTMTIQAVWKPGERPPTADEDEQPPLFGIDGGAEPQALGALAEKIVGAVESGVRPPAFSNLTGDRDE